MTGRAEAMDDLASAAAALVGPGKGILAVSESTGTTSGRLVAAGVAPTVTNRCAYREMLVTTPGLATGISGVVLSDETFRQRLCNGRLFPAALADLGMLAGIRVDAGAGPLAGTRGETITEGLDGLLPRLHEYAGLGARFAMWRAVLRIGAGAPTLLAIRANAHALGRFTSACQDAGLVALVEPAVLTNGSGSPGQSETVTSMVLLEVMSNLGDYDVDFRGVVVRLNMMLPGSGAATCPSPAEVAETTIGTLSVLPVALAGVAFMSGGQHPERATESLAAMQHALRLWPLTFAFGRGLVEPALAAWRGEPGRVRAGQRALAWRVSMNVAAVEGRYSPDSDASGQPRRSGGRV